MKDARNYILFIFFASASTIEAMIKSSFLDLKYLWHFSKLLLGFQTFLTAFFLKSLSAFTFLKK